MTSGPTHTHNRDGKIIPLSNEGNSFGVKHLKSVRSYTGILAAHHFTPTFIPSGLGRGVLGHLLLPWWFVHPTSIISLQAPSSSLPWASCDCNTFGKLGSYESSEDCTLRQACSLVGHWLSDFLKATMECWDLNSGPLEKQLVLNDIFSSNGGNFTLSESDPDTWPLDLPSLDCLPCQVCHFIYY